MKQTEQKRGSLFAAAEMEEIIGQISSEAAAKLEDACRLKMERMTEEQDGRPRKNMMQQVEEFISERYELRYNTMTCAAECRERGGQEAEFRPVTKRMQNSMVLNALSNDVLLWDRDMARYICSDRLPDFSPIEDFMGRLPEWDGEERIRPLMQRVPTGNPRWEEYACRWFLSMVAHWLGRDKQYGNALSPLLVGGQGCGKSTFCARILPPELRPYYADSLDFSQKRHAELALTRFALINIDEFDQVSERYQGFLKHLQQKPRVNVRRPYSGQVEEANRYASFIATSNHMDLLNDLSGSRRFICVEVLGTINNTDPIDYAQLYAEAVARLDAGERYWLSREEEQELMTENEGFRQRPLSEELFHSYFRPAADASEGERMTAGEIYLALQQRGGLKLPQGKLSPFGRFLRKTVLLQQRSNRGTLYRVVKR